MKSRYAMFFFACLLAGLVSWTAYAQNSQTTMPRTGWNYKVVAYISDNLTEGFAAQMFEDGVALPAPVPNGITKLKELGKQGWELVSVVSDPMDHYRTQTRYYFKRPI